MPKNLFQDLVFTVLMAGCMVYGMIVYNVALDLGGLTGEAFALALREMPVMVPIAVVLEMFVVGKIAPRLAFTFMKPTDRPQLITYAISFCIVCLMCPTMSLIAMLLFKDAPSFALWVQTWAMNLPAAFLLQFCLCGPVVRLAFRGMFCRDEMHARARERKARLGRKAAPCAEGEAR